MCAPAKRNIKCTFILPKLCMWECAVATCKRENIIFVTKLSNKC